MSSFLCTPYNHASCHFMQSHIRKVHACLAVTCHLHFWQNDWDLLRATAVTRGWNGYQNKNQYRKLSGEENSSATPAGIQTHDLSITSPALQPLSYPRPSDQKSQARYWRGFSQSQHSVQTFLRCSCVNSCVHVKDPKLLEQYHSLFGHTKTLEALIGMGSAALAGSSSLT